MQHDERLKEYIESSFLAPLLQRKGVTDISYNGEGLFLVDNRFGRQKSELEVTPSEVGDFLRQIANYAEKQFSYLDPVLDVSFAQYRLNATFLSITRVDNKKTYSFSLRIASKDSILEKDSSFFPGNSKKILLEAIEDRKSVVIGGETGCGKTELQKFLLSHMRPATRVIVIDNVEELELSRGDGTLDLTTWLVDPKNPQSSFPFLIRNALRNNPDYLLVAESRGEEMLDALNVVMSGHPLITTLHAKDMEAMPYRMTRMAMMSGKKLEFNDLLDDIYHHFSYMVYLDKSTTKWGVKRRIKQIGLLNEDRRTIDIIFDAGDAS
ncbi:MAG: CpaF/VirB11 family protein [Bacilli bacterium]|nr:CpaF/VirB11 family protein [Bacilli bacterium]